MLLKKNQWCDCVTVVINIKEGMEANQENTNIRVEFFMTKEVRYMEKITRERQRIITSKDLVG